MGRLLPTAEAESKLASDRPNYGPTLSVSKREANKTAADQPASLWLYF